jgi:hypothetical protein
VSWRGVRCNRAAIVNGVVGVCVLRRCGMTRRYRIGSVCMERHFFFTVGLHLHVFECYGVVWRDRVRR